VTSVVIVDDHPVVLAGLSALIEADPALVLVGTAATCAAALQLEAGAAPDVCVVDLQLPDGDGISLGAALKQRWPSTRVLILTMAADPAEVVRAVGSGLDGYVLKDSDPSELLAAVRATASGAVVLGRGASGPVVAAAAAVDAASLSGLDARDREILGLMVDGLAPTEIANRLYLAPKTIRNRITLLLEKLDVGTRDEAVALGRAAGLGG
jgi:DNA-binding NarL/FixJ family response regulator